MKNTIFAFNFLNQDVSHIIPATLSNFNLLIPQVLKEHFRNVKLLVASDIGDLLL